jgi:hypothetical protein
MGSYEVVQQIARNGIASFRVRIRPQQIGCRPTIQRGLSLAVTCFQRAIDNIMEYACVRYIATLDLTALDFRN